MTTSPVNTHLKVGAGSVEALYRALSKRHQKVFFAKTAGDFHKGVAAEQVLRPPYNLVHFALGLGIGISGRNPTGREVILSIAAGTDLLITQPVGARAVDWEDLPGNLYAFIPHEYFETPTWLQVLCTNK